MQENYGAVQGADGVYNLHLQSVMCVTHSTSLQAAFLQVALMVGKWLVKRTVAVVECRLGK